VFVLTFIIIVEVVGSFCRCFCINPLGKTVSFVYTYLFFDLGEDFSQASDECDLSTTENGSIANRKAPFYTFQWKASFQFLVLKWMNLQLVCLIAVPDSCGWRVPRLVG